LTHPKQLKEVAMLIRHMMSITLAGALFLMPAAQAAVTVGASDSVTGLQWAYASSLTEGQSLGYRAASSDEFQALLVDAGMQLDASLGIAGLTSELGPGSSIDGQGNTQLGSLTLPYGSILGFAPQAFAIMPMPEYSDFGVALAWLDGQNQHLAALGHFDYFRRPPCPTGVCTAVMWTQSSYVGGLASREQLLSAKPWSGFMLADGDTLWSLALPPNVGTEPGYAMVKASAVPEASTALMLALGLLGVGAATRTRRD
jgi:hypothetical protein